MKKIMYLMGILISFPLFAVQLQCAKGPVERAGMILVKVYPDGVPCVLVGKDIRQGYINFPAGECDLSDQYSFKAAARETMEETGNALHFSSKDVSEMDYIYSNRHKIELFIHRDDNLSVNILTASVAAAQSNPALGREYKEVDQYYAIPIQNLLDVAKGIQNAGYPSSQNISAQGLNAIKSKNGHNLVFESHYIAAIAQDYANAKNIFEKLTGQIFQ
ncbi:MAG: NUDIX hydrolase [Alphaproteobacteria bacterium]|nr:NUDIX hydrolase [Alphaproteobacteria bacterium]